MDRPSPVPCSALVVKKGSKQRCRTASLMPTPVSATTQTTRSPSTRVENVAAPPCGMASSALKSRFRKVSRSSAGSPATGGTGRELEPHRVRHAPRLGLVDPLRPRRLDHRADDLVDVHVLPGPGPAHSRELLDAPHGLRAVLGDVLDDLELAPQIGRLDLALQELGAPDDHREHVVEVVRDAAGHLAERAETLAPDDPLLGFLDRHEGGSELRVEAAVLEGHRTLGGQRDRQVLGARRERDGLARRCRRATRSVGLARVSGS